MFQEEGMSQPKATITYSDCVERGQLKSQLAVAVEALRFYAENTIKVSKFDDGKSISVTFPNNDSGEIAREALKKIGEIK